MPSPSEMQQGICKLVAALSFANGHVNPAMAHLAVGGQASAAVQAALYIAVAMAGIAALLAVANLAVRAGRGTLWMFRLVRTPHGDYMSPHAAATFSVASLFAAIGCLMLAVWVIELWNGRFLSGLAPIQTLCWLPLWIGGFCMVWGTAIATLSLNRNRRSVNGAPTPQGRYFIPPLFFNGFIILFPLSIVATIVSVFSVASKRMGEATGSLRSVLRVLSAFRGGTSSSAQGLDCSLSPDQVVQLVGPLLELHNLRKDVARWYRIGFAVYAGSIFLLLILWVPFFAAQYDILSQQIRRATRARKRQRRAQQHQPVSRCASLSATSLPSPPLPASLSDWGGKLGGRNDRFTRAPPPRLMMPRPSEGSWSASGSTSGGYVPASQYAGQVGHTSTVTSVHVVKMRGAYRALLGASFVFALMVLCYLGLSLWVAVDPTMVTQGEGSNCVLLLSIGVFGILGSFVNGVNLYRAIATPPHFHSTVGGAPSSVRLSPMSPRLPPSPRFAYGPGGSGGSAPSPPSPARGPPTDAAARRADASPRVCRGPTNESDAAARLSLPLGVHPEWKFPLRQRYDSQGTSTTAAAQDGDEVAGFVWKPSGPVWGSAGKGEGDEDEDEKNASSPTPLRTRLGSSASGRPRRPSRGQGAADQPRDARV